MLLSLTSLGTVSTFFKGTDVPILNLDSWPSAEDLDLDDSQFRALQMALTKEFAVIQGPPGTGKTYIGLKVGLNVLQLVLLSYAITRQGCRKPMSISNNTKISRSLYQLNLFLADCQCFVAQQAQVGLG